MKQQQIRQEKMRQILRGMKRNGWVLESCVRTAIFKDDFSGHINAFLKTEKFLNKINFSQLIQFNAMNYILIGGERDLIVEFLESCIETYGKTIFSLEELQDIQLMIAEYLNLGAGYNALHEG